MTAAWQRGAGNWEVVWREPWGEGASLRDNENENERWRISEDG